jgi:hypothetical protein
LIGTLARACAGEYKTNRASTLGEGPTFRRCGPLRGRAAAPIARCAESVTWRRERQAGVLKGLTPHKRGPKSKRNPLEEDNQKLRRENQRLTEELRKAAIVIDVQKKVGALLGWPLPKADPEEKP